MAIYTLCCKGDVNVLNSIPLSVSLEPPSFAEALAGSSCYTAKMKIYKIMYSQIIRLQP